MQKIVAKKGNDVPPGNHKGYLRNPEIRTSKKTKTVNGVQVVEDAVYVDYEVHTDGCENILRASYPANITNQSALGRLIHRFTGAVPEPEEEWDPKTIDGARVSYVVKPDGVFVRVDPETVSPTE